MAKTKNTTKATGRKATKVAKSSENQTPTSTIEASASEAPSTDFPPYDAEAWAWMSQESIRGAFSPILYIGTGVSVKVSRLLGRPMNLTEARHLVQADGDKVICASEGTKFQPVKYLPFLPKGLEAHLAGGKPLTEIDLPYGGAYYVDKKERVLIAYSGSVFHYNPSRQDYEWCHSSPLVIIAEEFRKAGRGMQWGNPLQVASRMMKSTAQNQERRKKISSRVPSLLSNRKGLGSVKDGLNKHQK